MNATRRTSSTSFGLCLLLLSTIRADAAGPPAAWTAESNLTNTYLGTSLRTAGDVNGDGYSDVLVSTVNFSNGQTGEGKVFLYLGSASGLAAAPAWTMEGEQAGAAFGNSVSTAGDVNGDGYDDVLIAANTRDNGQTDEGQVFLFLGSASGLGATSAWSVEGNAISFGLGDAVSTAGDVNGDGYDDILIGAICATNGQDCEGKAWLYLGSASGPSGTAAWTAEGNQISAYFGGSLGWAGDVNSDGYADVIVGASGYANGQPEEGAAFIYHGSASGLSAAPARILDNNQSFSGFGSSVSAAGDVDFDGYADVIVGAPGYTNGQTGEGAFYIFRGSAAGISATASWIRESNQGPTFNQGTAFGGSVATAGDVNGDGYADVIAGAKFYDNPTIDEGMAAVYLGGVNGLAATPFMQPESDQLNSSFGGVVAAAGDVNGDGFSDVLVSANSYDNGQTNEGMVFLYAGSGSAPATSVSWSMGIVTPNAHMGRSVAFAGDVNGDSYSDIVLGAPDGGGGEVQVYTGLPWQFGSIPAWSAQGTQTGEKFGRSVAGAGDVNGDGLSDVIVGSPDYDGGVTGQGKASVYLGVTSFSALETTPAWTMNGGTAGGHFGNCVASAGDVNGDGYSDVIVAGGNVSTPRVYHGSASGLSTTYSWFSVGGFGYGEYLPIVASAGDVNADGYSDVIVTWPGYSGNGMLYQGLAYVYMGSPAGLSGVPSWVTYGAAAYSMYGMAAATAGDVNGDGYSDVIIGAPSDPSQPLTNPHVYIYRGSASGLNVAPSTLIVTNDPPGTRGMSVASAGDVNGDGYSDILIGLPSGGDTHLREGRALIYFGSSGGIGAPAWIQSPVNAVDGEFGRSVSSAGDANGDGFADVLVGATGFGSGQGAAYFYFGNGGDGFDHRINQYPANGPLPIALRGRSNSRSQLDMTGWMHTPAGRGLARWQWEFKPLASPFTGTGAGSGMTPVRDTGAGGFPIYYESWRVSGLAEGMMYHWRARVISRNPFFPRAPWTSMPGSGITETKLRTSGCVDRDGDLRGALADAFCQNAIVDCDDHNGAVWSAPGVTPGLAFASKTTLTWGAPSNLGGMGASVAYDTLRSNAPGSFDACIDGSASDDRTTTDADVPPPGSLFFYVTRARNVCPNGLGSLGTTSSGQERTGLGTCQ